MGKLKIPKKITPDPIVDAILEIRFQPSIQEELVFGKLFNIISQNFPNFAPSEIPNNLKKQEPNLKYKSDGNLYNSQFSVGITSNALTFNGIGGYHGWNTFKNIVKSELFKIFELKLINKIERIGLRYVNLFDKIDNIIDNINLNVNLNIEQEYLTNQLTFKTEIKKDPFIQTIMVSNKAKSLKDNKQGLLIDIDTSITEIPTIEFNNNIMDIIESLHTQGEIMFFALLKENFLINFNPEY